MSKVGILTASRTDNNGTDLQVYAMQSLFSSFFDCVEVIDYRNEKLEEKLFDGRVSLRQVINFPIKLFSIITHRKFRKRYVHKSNKKYDFSNYIELSEDYELIIVGSDQIWNLNLTGQDLSFFLPGLNNKVSYAASFGGFDIVDNKDFDFSKLLSSFRYVSVREESTVPILKRLEIDAFCDLDPILMLGREKWVKLLPKTNLLSNYILLYLAEADYSAIDFALKLGSKYQFKVIMITNSFRIIRGVEQLRFVSVEAFLSLVNHAAYIVTNSYHCMSIGYVFNKELFVYKLGSNNERMESLALLTDSMQVFSHDCCRRELEWRSINTKLEKKRNESINRILANIVR